MGFITISSHIKNSTNLMTSPLTLRQLQVRSTLATLPFLIPLLYALSYFLFLDPESSTIQFFLRASLGPILGLLICWMLCPHPTSAEFHTAGINIKAVLIISIVLIFRVLVRLFPDTIFPSWVSSEANFFVSSFVATYVIFFIAFRHLAQKLNTPSSQPNQLAS